MGATHTGCYSAAVQTKINDAWVARYRVSLLFCLHTESVHPHVYTHT
jgi:hypothetical protein